MRAPDLVAARRSVVVGKHAAYFHRIGRDARRFDGQANDARGGGEGSRGLGGVAVFEVEADIAGNIVVHERRADREGGIETDHRRQILVIDFNQIGGIDRGGVARGNDQRDFLAGEAHAIAREVRSLGHDRLRAAAAGRRRKRRQRLESDVGEVAAGEHGDDAGGA